MNPTTSLATGKIESLLNWFTESIESLDKFGEYDQLQLIICAHELDFEHPNIDRKVDDVANRAESQSMDYVFQFLEQLVLMKYKVGEARQQYFFDYWIQQENIETQSLVTIAYLYGYMAMEENVLPNPELKQRAITWLRDTTFLPSMSFTAWTAYYLDQNGEHEAAKERFDELINLRMDDGSWNNYPLQTIQIAFPLSLTSFATNERMKKTNEFILDQPWETFSGQIPYETGLLKWLKANELI